MRSTVSINSVWFALHRVTEVIWGSKLVSCDRHVICHQAQLIAYETQYVGSTPPGNNAILSLKRHKCARKPTPLCKGNQSGMHVPQHWWGVVPNVARTLPFRAGVVLAGNTYDGGASKDLLQCCLRRRRWQIANKYYFGIFIV